jgi:hypothetical protein
VSALLEFIYFKDVVNWSVVHLLESQFQYNKNFKLEKIGSFLKRNKTQIILDNNTEYKRVKIKLYNKGVLLRNNIMARRLRIDFAGYYHITNGDVFSFLQYKNLKFNS